MSEFDKICYCKHCKKETMQNCSGSGRKKTCFDCGKENNNEKR